MNGPELSRIIRLKQIRHDPVLVEASEEERAALAERFGIVGIKNLRAEVQLGPKGNSVSASGTLRASIMQACAISDEEFPVNIAEELTLLFVPAAPPPTLAEGDELEVELRTDEPDEIEYDGDSFDLGEAIAQTLALAIDPYAEGPNANAVREKVGIVTEDTPSGPLAEALAALKTK